ncbi:S9 family peptidase [Rhabdothermincola sediminis]|uniref:S9 family peptidase n=1 Tax=Rhabdothermincola sediminis TaxID=2751370 RepID=UPI001AA06555|nr:prolyl oligopeptidase family serine peptidase [Rhabdothermincola sediminis]
MTRLLPYGSWPSPISAGLIVEHAVSIGEVAVGTDDVWWSELRPQEGGRVAVVRHRPGGEQLDVLPEGWSARTRVHEYGGGAWWLHDDALFFANWADQRLYRLDGHGSPRPLTPEPPRPGADRYADGRVTVDGRFVVCVRERHRDGAEPVNELVALDAHDGGEPAVLVSGPDFVSFPRLSPDGRRLCWTQWNHPDMPWDATELWVAELEERSGSLALAGARPVAGGPGESIFQPEWVADGSLLFASDRNDWWNLYRLPAAHLDATTDSGSPPEAEAVVVVDGDIGVPQWVFGLSRYAPLADGRLLVACARDGVDHLLVAEQTAGGWVTHPLDTPFTAISAVHAFGEGAVLVGASFTVEPSVVVASIPAGGGSIDVAHLRPPRRLGVDERWFSVPEPVTFPTADGEQAHALLYRPTNLEVRAPDGERPPLVVISHGGPTAAARPQLNLTIQYWTSRGLAVADVNYRGSSGYGRRYREALAGRWGIADVEDCTAVASFLAARGDVAADRLAIRGSSAGGFTTLCALAFHDVFDAGASLYGVSDLEALARDTHKFESRYLDRLVGPYPAARDRYVERSPIHHADRIGCPVIVFQGLEDEIVPPDQAEVLVAALRAKGLPVAYLAFEGEQHGFRRAETIERVLEAELYFYGRVLGFDLADPVEPVEIENL